MKRATRITKVTIETERTFAVAQVARCRDCQAEVAVFTIVQAANYLEESEAAISRMVERGKLHKVATKGCLICSNSVRSIKAL
jgi:hypothetical protein